jgi:hypothetical protein
MFPEPESHGIENIPGTFFCASKYQEFPDKLSNGKKNRFIFMVSEAVV